MGGLCRADGARMSLTPSSRSPGHVNQMSRPHSVPLTLLERVQLEKEDLAAKYAEQEKRVERHNEVPSVGPGRGCPGRRPTNP